jgi:hydrogenase expression/formation protein HypC
MCLGIPGEIVQIEPESEGFAHGLVSFGGVKKRICLAYVPQARVGDYAIVHAGFALNLVDVEEAQAIFQTLAEIERAMADALEPPIRPIASRETAP